MPEQRSLDTFSFPIPGWNAAYYYFMEGVKMHIQNDHQLQIIALLLLLFIIPLNDLPGAWNLDTIDRGRSGTIAIDSAGVVHVAYLDNPFGSDVAYAVRENDHWTITTLTNSDEIYGISLAIDTTGTPHIVYAEADVSTFDFDLKRIRRTKTGWSSPETILTTEDGKMIWAPAIQIDRDNHIHITCLLTDADAGSGVIYYVTNASGPWESVPLNNRYQNPASYHVAMALDTEGYAHIASYFPALGGPGYMTNAPGGQWSGTELIQLNWYGGQLEALMIDIALDPDNNPHVSYVGSYDGSAVEHHMYAMKTGPNAPWDFQKLDEGTWTSTGNTIASDLNGVEHIAYYHIASGELRYTMNYSGSWPNQTLDTPEATTNNYLRYVDITTDREGFVHIIYESDDNVRYATTRIEIPAPNIVLSPTSLVFGTVDTGQVSTKSLYIKNEGVLDLHLSDVTLAGGDSAEFSLIHLCDTMVPGDSCAVQITFKPVSLGEKHTALKITSDDPDTPVISAAIRGRTPYPVIQTDPMELEFDLTDAGELDTQVLTVMNTGDADLEIDSLTIRGESADEFSYNSPCGIIAEGAGCDIEMNYSPREAGRHAATFHIYSNDPENPEVTVPLEGRTPSARIEVTTEVLDFGTIPVGNLATGELVIGNTGERQLNISSVSISGTNASLFRSTNTCGVISSGGSCTLDLTFLPRSVGQKSALLSIASNDPVQPVYSIILRGTGGEIQNMAFIYRTEENERFYCMDTLSSGDFIVGGGTGEYPCIVVIDPDGNILWQKTFSSGASGDAIHAVKELWDHGYVVAGQISGRYRWIARLDSDGEILWQKRAEEDYWGDIHDVIVTSDSGLVAVGETWPSGPNDPDMWISRLDSSGATLWQKRIGKPFAGNLEPNYERGLTVLEVEYGNFIVAGGGTDKTPFNALVKHPDGGYLYGGDKANFWKFSPAGDVLWQRKLDPTGGSDFWLAHISPGDAILWQKKYPQADVLIEHVYDLTLTAAGDIIAVGSIISANNNDMRVMRLTKSGDIIWQKEFTAPGHQEGYKVLVHSNGSIAIAGYYDPDIQNEDGWLVLLSPDGNLDGCASNFLVTTDAAAVSGSNTFTTITLPSTDNLGDFIDADLAVSDGVFVARNLCTGIPVDVDYDGVDDSEEAGPDGQDANYDGNNDGLPDCQQDNVASMHNYDGSGYLTISTGQGTCLRDVTAEENPSPTDQPEEFDFPLGFFSFTITGIDTGASAIVDIILPDGSAPLTYYKYAATTNNQVPHWYEFLYDGSTGADIHGNEITLHFIDGQLGDEDLLENAVVRDIGGPGMTATSLYQATDLPDCYALEQNYPNPFNSLTRIHFQLPRKGHVRLALLNIRGQVVRELVNGDYNAGYHHVEIDVDDLPTGMYFYHLEADQFSGTRKLVLIK